MRALVFAAMAASGVVAIPASDGAASPASGALELAAVDEPASAMSKKLELKPPKRRPGGS